MPDRQNAQGADGGGHSGQGGANSISLRSWFQTIKNNMRRDSLVGAGGIILTALFLISLTVALLYGITMLWPVCHDELSESGNPGAANSNAGVGANVNANVNADATANVNAAANANGNVNAPPRAAASPTPAGAAAPVSLDADSIEPVSGPTTGKTQVIIRGKNFGTRAQGLVVKFGEVEAKVATVADNSISVRTQPHSEGLVDVTVERDGARDVLSSAFTYTCPAPVGSDLFRMLIMAGALGGCIHAMRSLYWYAGQRELRWSWLPMYFALPFIGAAMAMLFSLLIVAGFVSDTAGRSQSLFIIAVAGLVGMFSQQASLKLTDIANAFFTKPGAGTDAKPQKSVSVDDSDAARPTPLAVKEMSPNTGSVAGGEEVTIVGEGFTSATVVSFGGAASQVKTASPTSITVFTPAHVAGGVDVEVRSGNQALKLPTAFTYTE